jgi:hypothetical protein
MHCKFAGSFGLLLSTAMASAIVIDFNGLGAAGNSYALIAAPYLDSGFRFTNSAGNVANAFTVWQFGSPHYAGSPALAPSYFDSITTLAAVDSSPFDVISIDLAAALIYHTDPVPVSFVGIRADGITITNSFTVTDLHVFHPFAFAGMTDIVALSWAQAAPYHQIDNVTLSPAPEPASMLALLVGVAYCHRRRFTSSCDLACRLILTSGTMPVNKR